MKITTKRDGAFTNICIDGTVVLSARQTRNPCAGRVFYTCWNAAGKLVTVTSGNEKYPRLFARIADVKAFAAESAAQ